MQAPKMVLDLFCGAGGAAMGLHQAWPDAEIVGVDIKPQPRYPFAFIQWDAMMFPLEGFDFIWASPPCQKYVCRRQGWDDSKHPDLIGPIRSKLMASKVPFVIENVSKAPLRPDVILCGVQFGLKVFRHRWFEIEGFQCSSPIHKKHDGHVYTGEYCTVYNGGDGIGGHGNDIIKRRATRAMSKALGVKQTFERWCVAMQIEWMTKDEITQAIPPAYSRYIAEQFLDADLR